MLQFDKNININWFIKQYMYIYIYKMSVLYQLKKWLDVCIFNVQNIWNWNEWWLIDKICLLNIFLNIFSNQIYGKYNTEI